ncbi:universal stress protein [Motilimonas eburnea]|uniref:universal stress protein n=1 Tax=Motilimonas eburnea TaxID=1737488 RepID=UPI001E2FA151|nr:universal stress protein [Motilimonas eburnea]MCE2571887.1 universal stress protein [Motilimonas eburnea]
MKNFANILFATQGMPGYTQALDQAFELAVSNQVTVNGLIACPPFPQDLKHYQTRYQESLLGAIHIHIEELRSRLGVSPTQPPFPLSILHHEQPAVGIIKSVIEHHHDLLIKEAEPVGKSKLGFKAIDMTLLRKCPCPIWLHRPTSRPKKQQKVAVALDPNVTDDKQYYLALRLLEIAKSIADTTEHPLQIFTCWEYLSQSYLADHARLDIDTEQLAAEEQRVQQRHQNQLEEIIEKSDISDDFEVHYLHGRPDDMIPDAVAKQHIDVLVMGTLARTGIFGLVIGNTAENILQSINCSLVALKPKGFESPIK